MVESTHIRAIHGDNAAHCFDILMFQRFVLWPNVQIQMFQEPIMS